MVPGSDGQRPHVVIIGGGFGGLYAARALRHAPVRITLLDRRNHHLFQPLLYQVATAGLNASDIATPIRAILRRQKNVVTLLADASAIDAAAQKIELADGGALAFDYLIVATGATHSYFGHDAWSPLAPGLKTVEDALEIRKRVLYAFEEAEQEPDPERRRAWLTFAIVGAGPTGVELAGSLSELARHTLRRDFRRIDPTCARIVLLEGADHLLGSYPPSLQTRAIAQLQRLGVEVQLGRRVTDIDHEGVSIGNERIAAKTVLWSAGVAASPLARSLGVPLDRAGRVLVTPTLNPPGYPRVFVIGDLAAVRRGESMVPGVAPAAIQGGRYAAAAIVASIAGRPSIEPFRYVDKGSLATIGRSAAIANLPGGIRLSGFIAWWAWLFIHILLLIGFRNRVLVLIEWAWAYLFYQRGARLITGLPSAERSEVTHAAGSIGDPAQASHP
jgi:NADH dehydrogenase